MNEDFWGRLIDAAESLDDRSYYEVLGVAADAQGAAIRDAYYRMVKRVHPDRYARERRPERKRALVKLYARLGEAYRNLSDPALRARYDAGLGQGHTRLAPDAKPVGRPLVDQRDPKTPQGRQLYERGMALLRTGDRKAARAQLQLAAQFEPDSKAIACALADSDDSKPTPPGPQPKSVAADADADEPAPESAPEAPTPEPQGRAHPRHDVVHPVSVRCRRWTQVETFYTENISAGGMFLKTQNPPEVGSELQLSVALPDGRRIAIRCRVAHAIGPGNDAGRTPGIGVQFEDIDPRTIAALEQLVARRRKRITDPHPESPRVVAKLENVAARMKKLPAAGVLGVGSEASAEDVRRAYVALARKFHPDRFGRFASPAVTSAADEVAFLVRQAYDQLLRGLR